MCLKFLVNEPAALLGQRLIIADPHFGFDHEYGLKFSKLLLNRLLELAGRHGVREIVVLGDFKDEILRTPDHILFFIREIEEYFDLILVQGNHDATLDRYHEVYKFLRIGDVGMLHGHTRIPEEFDDCRHILMGHVHPSFNGEPVWLRSQNITIFPAFNPSLIYPLEQGMGKIGEKFKIEHIILLSGVRIR